MPCTDGGVPYPPTEKEELDALAPAMLCAMLSWSGDVPDFDEVEAGVSRAQVRRWWKLHQAEDKKRRMQEKQSIKNIRRAEEVEFERLKRKLGK